MVENNILLLSVSTVYLPDVGVWQYDLIQQPSSLQVEMGMHVGKRITLKTVLSESQRGARICKIRQNSA